MTAFRLKLLLSLSFLITAAACAGDVSETGTKREAVTSCPASPAPKLMTHAICLCDRFDAVGKGLTTTAPNGGEANVAINGQASVVGHYEIDGSLLAYKGISGVGRLTVRDDAITFGSVDGVGELAVGRDLAVKGDLNSVGMIAVGGLTKVGGLSSLVGTSQLTRAPFDVVDAKPCGCDAATKLDIAQKIADAKANTQVARLEGIDSVGAHVQTLKSGSYYLAGGIRAVGSSKLTIEGGVALFVDGDLDTVGDGLFDVKAGATLDLYVNGKISSVGKSVFTSGSPGAVRLYLGGANPSFSGVGTQDLTLSIYAPDAELNLVGDTRINGSVFAKSIGGVGHLQVDYAAPAAPAPALCKPVIAGGGGNTAPAGNAPGTPGSGDGIN